MKKSLILIALLLGTFAAATAQYLLPMPQWSDKPALLTGQIVGYADSLHLSVEAHPRMVYDQNIPSCVAKIEEDGSFRLQVPMFATHQGMTATIGPWYGIIVLSAGDSTHVVLNLPELLKSHPRDRVLSNMMPGVEHPLTFSGAMAELNNEISRAKARDVIWHSFTNVSYGKLKEHSLSPQAFQEAVEAHRNRDLQWVDTLDFTAAAKEWLRCHIETSAVLAQFHTTEYINTDDYGKEYYRRMQLPKFNSLRYAYTAKLDGLANWIGSSFRHDSIAVQAWAESINDEFPDGIEPEEFNRRYPAAKQAYVNELLGSERGVLQDGMAGQRFANRLETDTPLDDDALAELSKLENRHARLHFVKCNNKIIYELARRTAQPGEYTIHKTPENSGEQFLSESCAQFAGRVILVDLWGTWCGPCRGAIRRFEKSHRQLAERGLVTLYVTDTKSPEEEWKNMASGMPGEHYRLYENQTREIFAKFGFTGWPSYIIIDKKGSYIYQKTGFDMQKMVEVIEKALDE